MDAAFKYVETSPGVDQEAFYPYTGKDNAQCNPSGTGVGHVVGFEDVKTLDVDQLIAAVMLAPVSIAVEADKQIFQWYSSGVIDATGGCGQVPDHGVLAVGYGTDKE